LLNDYTWFSRRSAAEECPEGLIGGCERTLVGVGKSGGADVRLTVDEPSWHASTMLGVDSRLRHARSELVVEDRMTGAVAPFSNDYTRFDALIAPYLQQSFSPYRWLDANLGARFDYDTRFGHELSPRAALGVSPWDSGRIKAIYSEAFRGPTAYELNYADPVEQVAAPGLSAESVRSLELSIEQKIGPHRLFFGVFRSAWTGLVSYRTLSDDEVASAVEAGALKPTTALAYSYANAGKIENYGYNAAYEGRLGPKLRLAGNLTSAYSRVDLGDGSGSLPLTVGPAVFGNARISYDTGGSWPTPALALHYLAARPADRAFDGGFARAPYAPADLQLRLTLSGVVPGVRGLRYRVSSMFDTASRGAYVVGPTQYAADASSQATLSPQRRASAFLGMEYAVQ
jgi:hypothetical protein